MMKYSIKINLLPYRKVENDQNKKKFILNIIFSIVISLFFSIFVFFTLKINYFHKTIKSNYLNNEIKLLGKKLDIYRRELNYNKHIKDERLVLEKIQVDRYKFYRILNDLNSFLPDKGVYLTNINFLRDNIYIIKGKSMNDNLLALFMKSIPSTGLFKSVNLSEIQSNNKSKENNFIIKAFLFDYGDNNSIKNSNNSKVTN